MVEHPIEGDFKQWVVNAFRQSPLFSTLDPAATAKVMSFARLQEYESGEVMAREGEPADRFWILLMGEVRASVAHVESGEPIELARLRANEAAGEVGLMLDQPRSATLACTKQTYALQFDKAGFDYLVDRIPGFAGALYKSVAERLVETDRNSRFPMAPSDVVEPGEDVVRLLPMNFVLQNHVLPLGKDGNTVRVGFVDPPTRDQAQRVRQSLGDLDLAVELIRMSDFKRITEKYGLAPSATASKPPALPRGGSASVSKGAPMSPVPLLDPVSASGSHPIVIQTTQAPKEPARLTRQQRKRASSRSMVATLDQLAVIRPMLEQMPQVNASDLHIGAGEIPRWRIDGDLYEMPEYPAMESEAVLDLFEPLMSDSAIEEFNRNHDCDFAFAVDGLARFRANVFRDDLGVGAVLRIIPMHVLGMEQLGIPKAARAFCDLHQGLVLVCGPTGCGKSTTLAAMLDHINNNRRSHIITLEDPIEFVHQSRMSLVTQREVGKSTISFTRGLRSSLREDPDIVLVGELRDRETLELALQTSQTGHLVLGTLHTSTAIGTVDRIIDMFPVDQHNQVRSTLADQLKGVINQHLCKRIGGGRVAAFECLVGGSAVANCIRQGKNHQIETVMTTNRSEGHRYLNDDLWELVRSRAVEPLEALKHSDNKKDLRQRLGIAA